MQRYNLLKTGLALVFSLACSLFSTNAALAADKPYKTNIKTLLIVSHPYPERSIMIRGLQQAAAYVIGKPFMVMTQVLLMEKRNVKSPVSTLLYHLFT